MTKRECERWLRGIRFLVDDTLRAPYPLQIVRWLRREFNLMVNNNNEKGM